MAQTAGEKIHSLDLPTNTRRVKSAPLFSPSGGIRETRVTTNKTRIRKPIRLPGPPAHRKVQALYDEKIAALEKENNHLRNWWWVDMMDHPRKQDIGADDRRSEQYRREHWLRGLHLAAGNWVEADYDREKLLRADMRAKEREARTAKEEAEKVKLDLAAAQIELAAVKEELEEKKQQSAIDRQLAMDLLATTQ